MTHHAQGYKHVDRVGHILFPYVEVVARGGNVIEFGKESFRRYNVRRAPGTDTKSITIGYEGKPFQLVQDALNSPVPREHLQDAQTVPNIDLGMRATNTIMNSLTLALECEQAEIATNPDLYADDHKISLAGTSKWSDVDSDPITDIDAAKEAVRSTSGVDPNVMVVSKSVFNALKRHPKIQDKFKYTTADSITADMIANILDLEKLAVGKTMALAEDDSDNAPFGEVWDNVAILAYVPQNSLGFEEPSYGYTYRLPNHPFAEKPFWNNSKKSWIYGVTYERKPVLTGISSGYLFSNVVD